MQPKYSVKNNIDNVKVSFLSIFAAGFEQEISSLDLQRLE